MSDARDLTVPDQPTDYTALRDYIWDLAKRRAGFSFTFLGGTLLGKGIPVIAIGNEDAKDAFLYVGAHHASEHITTSALLLFADDFLASAGREETEYGVPVKDISSRSLIYVVPALNCDGIDIAINGAGEECLLKERLAAMNGGTDFTRWQANARGVDLNHNYDAGFKEYKESERRNGKDFGSPSRYSGEYPESEPEVGALCNFIRFNRRIKGILTLHTQGEEIYRGYGEGSSERIAKEVARVTGYSIGEPEGGAAFGGLTDWATSVVGIPSFTIECGRGENPLPSSDLVKIYSDIRELLFTFPLMFNEE